MRKFKVRVNGRTYEVEVEELGGDIKAANAAAQTAPAPVSPAAAPTETMAPPTQVQTNTASEVSAPLPGVILEVRVQPGQQVAADEVVVVLEAMKMENELTAVRAGTVKDVLVEVGATVGQGETLVILE